MRHGAVLALVGNTAYSLTLIVLHAVLLGEHGLRPHWFVQLLDLDLSWGHGLLGFDDFSCLISGLLYGIVIFVASAIALHDMMDVSHGPGRPALWFVVFGHGQLLLIGCTILVKFPVLCKHREKNYPDLEPHCDVMRFTFLWRQVVFFMLAAFALWIITSCTQVNIIEVDDLTDQELEIRHAAQTGTKYRVAYTRALPSVPERPGSGTGFRGMSFGPNLGSWGAPRSSRDLTQAQNSLIRPGSQSFSNVVRPPVAVY